MTKEELEKEISMLEARVEANKTMSENYVKDLAKYEQRLKDLGKIALPPVVFDDIYEAIDSAVCGYDFSDSGNYDIEFGLEYDGKVFADSIELQNNSDLIEAIVAKVSRIFTEAECPEELDTTEKDNHEPV